MIIFIIVLCVILFVLLVVYLVLKFYGLNKIYTHKHSRHYLVLKNKNLITKKGEVIELSSKETSKGKKNIPMHKNPEVDSTEPSYIIPNVRNRKLNDMTKPKKKFRLSKEDRKTTDVIYKKHVKNTKELKKGINVAQKRKKNSKKHKNSKNKHKKKKLD